jgi:hypothetical protein
MRGFFRWAQAQGGTAVCSPGHHYDPVWPAFKPELQTPVAKAALCSGRGFLNYGPNMLHFASAPLADHDSAPNSHWPRVWLVPLALLALALLGCGGCSTVGGTSGSGGDLTALTVQAASYDQVGQAAMTVFVTKGYGVDFNSRKQLVFSKKGSAGSNLLYGGWPGIDSSVVDRVQVNIDAASPGFFVLRCNAALVSNAGQGFFEDSRSVYKVRAGAYHSLLKAVKKQLDSEAKAAPPALLPP